MTERMGLVFFFCAKEALFQCRHHNSYWTHTPRNSARLVVFSYFSRAQKIEDSNKSKTFSTEILQTTNRFIIIAKPIFLR